MQNFAIDGGALNGDPLVWIDDAAASIVIQAGGEVMHGHMLSGGAQVALSGSLPLALHARFAGAASMALQASGGLARGTTLSGSASLLAASSGDFTRWAMLDGTAPVEFDVTGDLQVVPAVSAAFTLEVRASGDIRVAGSQLLEGVAPVELRPSLSAWSVRATHLDGHAPLQIAGIGRGILRVALPEGLAIIAMSGQGEARLGGKLALEGSAGIGFYARGDIDWFRYVFIERALFVL